jgi:hypothetical protein
MMERTTVNDRGGDVADRIAGRIEAQAALGQRRNVWARLRFDYRDVRGRKPERHPAFQHGSPHFAGAGEQDGLGQAGQWARHGVRIRC